MTRLRAAFLGNDPWSVPSLEALVAAGISPSVFTFPPRPSGRGSALRPTEVAVAAERLGLPLVQAPSVLAGPGREELEGARPDVLIVVAYGEILTREILDLASMGAVNLHFSLLPRYRGATPVRAALAAGDSTTGVTTMLLDEGMDTGPILRQVEEPIAAQDDAGSLGARLAEIGARVLVDTLADVAAGVVVPREQNETEASSARRIERGDRGIDWSREAEAIVGQVRAMAPEPGATTRFRGHGLKVLRASVGTGSATEPAGTIVSVGKDGFTVSAGTGTVDLLEVGPAGRKRMSAADFMHGYAPRRGERLD